LGDKLSEIKQEPKWLFQIPKPRALLVVTHADDETIFAGGLILSSNDVRWTIVCVNLQTQTRKKEFLSACKFLEEKSGNNIDPVPLNPVYNPKGKVDSNWLKNKLKSFQGRYDFVLTYNKEGEYGHENHKIVHQCSIEAIQNLNTWLFISPGSTNVNQENLMSKHLMGNVTINLSPEVQKLKINAFQKCHKSQVELFGYDPVSKQLKDSNLKETLQWEFESGKEQYTFFI
jgi:LmbE family N-acetylglucosaminyl deacetylase